MRGRGTVELREETSLELGALGRAFLYQIGIGRGGSVMCFRRSDIEFPPVNGTRPASIW